MNRESEINGLKTLMTVVQAWDLKEFYSNDELLYYIDLVEAKNGCVIGALEFLLESVSHDYNKRPGYVPPIDIYYESYKSRLRQSDE